MINGMRVEKRPDEFFENLALLTGKPKGNAVYHKDDHVLYVTAPIYQKLNESISKKKPGG